MKKVYRIVFCPQRKSEELDFLERTWLAELTDSEVQAVRENLQLGVKLKCFIYASVVEEKLATYETSQDRIVRYIE